MLLLIQIQILAGWMAARDRVLDTLAAARDERGELTGNVIFLAALAVAAAIVAALVVSRINSNANKIPAG